MYCVIVNGDGLYADILARAYGIIYLMFLLVYTRIYIAAATARQYCPGAGPSSNKYHQPRKLIRHIGIFDLLIGRTYIIYIYRCIYNDGRSYFCFVRIIIIFHLK